MKEKIKKLINETRNFKATSELDLKMFKATKFAQITDLFKEFDKCKLSEKKEVAVMLNELKTRTSNLVIEKLEITEKELSRRIMEYDYTTSIHNYIRKKLGCKMCGDSNNKKIHLSSKSFTIFGYIKMLEEKLNNN